MGRLDIRYEKQASMDTQKEFLFQHDKRCETIEKSMEEISLRMEGKQ